MSFTVFLGNLPTWVTADDIRGWLSAENLVADAIKVIRNPETQESKGFAFIDAPNTDEMNSIIRRFDRAPLEDRLLRANPAQPPKPKVQGDRDRDRDRDRRPHPHSGGAPGGSSAGSHASRGGHSAPDEASSHTSGQSGPVASASTIAPAHTPAATSTANSPVAERPVRRAKKTGSRREDGPQSAFAEELARAL